MLHLFYLLTHELLTQHLNVNNHPKYSCLLCNRIEIKTCKGFIFGTTQMQAENFGGIFLRVEALSNMLLRDRLCAVICMVPSPRRTNSINKVAFPPSQQRTSLAVTFGWLLSPFHHSLSSLIAQLGWTGRSMSSVSASKPLSFWNDKGCCTFLAL